jgi:DNA-binding GntR family transcriptional regulator
VNRSDEGLTLGAAHLPLRDQVREEIRNRITDGAVTPGTKLVERELAAELGVSRIPVREALRMLETEGFVQVVPRKGVVVRELSREDVEELFDVRQALEVLACRRAAERATTVELATMRQILDSGEQAVHENNRAGVKQSNEAFHDTLIKMTHNRLLAGILDPLQGRLHWLFAQSEDLNELVAEHRGLYKAILARDPEKAAALALEHVQINRAIAIRLLFGKDGVPVEAPA